MAVLAQATLEVGTLAEFFANAGTVAASQVQAHSGTWSVRSNPSVGAGTVSLRPPSGDMGRTALTIYVAWLRFASLPLVDDAFVSVQSSASSEVASVHVSAAGVVTGVGATTSASAGTLALNTWYAVILSVLSNGASSVRVDGLGAAQSFNANNVTQDRVVLGTVSVTTADAFLDDIAILDAFGTAGSVAPLPGVARAAVSATPAFGTRTTAAPFAREAARWL